MNCDVCLYAGKKEADPARYAVKENDVVLVLCEGCMEFLYGMHETVLLPADTYVPRSDEAGGEGETISESKEQEFWEQFKKEELNVVE